MEVFLDSGNDTFVLDTKSRRVFLVDGDSRFEIVDPVTKLKILAESSARAERPARKSSVD